jgi:hypothetical protein
MDYEIGLLPPGAVNSTIHKERLQSI